MVVEHQRLMPVLLGTEGPTHILTALHYATALVIEAQDGGHTVPTGGAFQRGGDMLGIANGPR